MSVAYVQDGAGKTSPVFTISPMFPLTKDFLRHVQQVAMTDKLACPVWGTYFRRKEDEESWYFEEKEWAHLGEHAPKPAPHRVDLYTIHRGLEKVFNVRTQEISIAARQAVLKAIFEQDARPSIFDACPRLASHVVQLALFDQVVY